MIGALRSYLDERWGTLRPGAPPLAGAIVAGVDREPSAKVTVILFDRTGSPSVVAKVARSAEAEAALDAEHSVLAELWSLGIRSVSEYAPEPLALVRIEGRSALFTTAVEGGPMTARYYSPGHTKAPALVAEDFHLASSWLRRFQRETSRGERLLSAKSAEEWILPVFSRYRTEVGRSDAEERLFEGVIDRAVELDGCRLPSVAVHGDFWMGNLLVSGNRLRGVVDWELARTSGLPFADLYKFPTSYAFYLDRTSRASDGSVPGHPGRASFERSWRRFGDWPNLAGFGFAYFGRGWFPEQVRRFVLGHLAAFGIPAAANGVFFPLFLAEQATTLDVPAFRNGYRSLLLAFGEERPKTWLWHEEVVGAWSPSG